MATEQDKLVQTFIQKKYFKGREVSLLVNQEKKLPMAKARLYRIRESLGKRGWVVLSSEKGTVIEVNTTDLHTFIESIKSGIASMSYKKKGEQEAKRISNILLNFLGTYRRSVVCETKAERSTCVLFFSEGPLKDEKVRLVFDFNQGFILSK